MSYQVYARVGPVDYVLMGLEPEEFEALVDDQQRREVVGVPRYFCAVSPRSVWPLPDPTLNIEIIVEKVEIEVRPSVQGMDYL